MNRTCACCGASLVTYENAVYARVVDDQLVGCASYPVCRRCLKRARKFPDRVTAALARRWERDHFN